MLTQNNANKQSACPSCEYQHGTKGKPVLEGGLMKCQDCGSTWRELGNSLEHILKDTAYDARFDTENVPTSLSDNANASSNLLAAGSMSHNTQSSWSIGKEGVLASIIVFAILFLAVTTIGQFAGSKLKGQLQISKVDVQEKVRNQGKKVFTVKGQLQNRSNETKRIPRITIILRQNNGREVVRWNYNSPKPTIRSGKELTFASSIQYDTPYVAYAEAIFN